MAPPKTPGAARGTVQSSVLNGLVNFTVRAIPLPETIIEFLQSHSSSIANMVVQRRTESGPAHISSEDSFEEPAEHEGVEQSRLVSSADFWEQLTDLFDKAGPEWSGAADRIWSFGPKRVGPCILLDPPGKTNVLRLKARETRVAQAQEEGQTADEALRATDDAVAQQLLEGVAPEDSDRRAEVRLLRDFESSVETGFQLASFQGPLCGEPVVGMAWVIENIELNKEEAESESGKCLNEKK